MKVMLYKGKHQKYPQQLVYDRVVELLRYNQEEAINTEKFYVRTKRKFVAFSVPGKMRKAQKFLKSDLDKQMEERARSFDEESKHVKSFEQTYL